MFKYRGNNNEHQATTKQLYHHHYHHHRRHHCTSSIPMAALYTLSATRTLVTIFILIVCFGAILAAFSLRAVLSKTHRLQQHSIYSPNHSMAATRIQREGSKEKRKGWNDLLLFSLSAGDLELEKRTAQVVHGENNNASVTNSKSNSLVTSSAESSASHHHHHHQWPSPSFDWQKSTEENYARILQNGEEDRAVAIDPSAVFSASKYASIREKLDYKYHKVYTTARQLFQDSIIDAMLRTNCSTSVVETAATSGDLHLQQPWIIFTAGVMGAGKTHTIKLLQQKGRFPPNQDFVVVDPDQMRHTLPEFEGYVRRSPEVAGELTRHEAGMMSEILILAALQEAGNNVLVDGSLRDHEWYAKYFARLRRDYPSFSIAILHITAPRQAVLERAKNRAKITGRVVPQKLLEEAMQQVPASVSRLRSIVDFFVEIHNSGSDREDDVQLVSMSSSSAPYMNKNVTWTEFTSQWRSTTCHHEHGGPQAVSSATR